MRVHVRRLVSAVSIVSLLGLGVATSTGCGLLGSMNPKVAWAATDPAPMSVVVRRADAAAITVKEVDRLLTATPTSPDSDWLQKVGPDAKESAADLAALKKDPMYMKSQSRVIPAEVWIRTLPAVISTGGDKPNLLAAIDQSLGDGYAEIMAKKQEIAGLSQQIEDEKAAADAKDATADDKKSHQDAAAKLDKTRSDKQAEVDPLQKKFLASIKAAAAKVPDDQKAKFSPAVANMIQALDDADIANSAAAIRWTLALKGIGDSIKEVVPAIAGDVIEEKVGTLPDLKNLKADIKIDGSSVSVTLSGLGSADLGNVDMGDLTKEVIGRSTKWLLHATTLLGTIDSTKQTLNFEHDVLSEIMAGFNPPAAQSATFIVKIPAFDSPEVTGATPAAHISLVSVKARAAKASAPPPPPPAPEPAVAVKADDKGGKGKKPTKPAAKPAKPGAKPANP